MNGTVTLTRGGQVTIHTYTAPEAGWRSASHLIELATYNDVHLYLAESTPEARREWIAALDTIESLHPRAVIAGHKHAGRADAPAIIEETRQYIRDFDRLAETTSTALELYERVLALYPDRVNPGALWSSARALRPPSS